MHGEFAVLQQVLDYLSVSPASAGVMENVTGMKTKLESESMTPMQYVMQELRRLDFEVLVVELDLSLFHAVTRKRPQQIMSTWKGFSNVRSFVVTLDSLTRKKSDFDRAQCQGPMASQNNPPHTHTHTHTVFELCWTCCVHCHFVLLAPLLSSHKTFPSALCEPSSLSLIPCADRIFFIFAKAIAGGMETLRKTEKALMEAVDQLEQKYKPVPLKQLLLPDSSDFLMQKLKEAEATAHSSEALF